LYEILGPLHEVFWLLMHDIFLTTAGVSSHCLAEKNMREKNPPAVAKELQPYASNYTPRNNCISLMTYFQ